MKKLNGGISWILMIFLSVIQVATWAQDSSSSSHSETTTRTTTTTTTWYAQPWVWVVGAAIFIIILVALFRGNSSRTDVSRTTTVVKDREI